MYMEGSLWLALCLPFKGLVQTLFFVIYQNLGADFCAPKSGYRSQEHPVLPPVCMYIYIYIYIYIIYILYIFVIP